MDLFGIRNKTDKENGEILIEIGMEIQTWCRINEIKEEERQHRRK